jgi:hypothetical protein
MELIYSLLYNMDYDFITTCNWTATGTYTLQAYRGSSTNVVTTYYDKIFYRKKGTSTWTPLNSSGQMVVDSTGEWEVANNWNKNGNNCLTHSYYGITAIDSCTDVYFNETSLGTTVGDYFLYSCWRGCSKLTSMPSGFNIPTGITSVGNYFLGYCWASCSALTSMPSGFNIPTGITSVGNSFLRNCWYACYKLTSMPSGFNIPTGITSVGNSFLNSCWYACYKLTSMPSGFNIPTGITSVGDYFLNSCWASCTSLTSMPVGFNLPSGITSVGSSFLRDCWDNCTSLTSMPSGFNLPSGITTVGNYFLADCWYGCTLLKADGYTENIDFPDVSGVGYASYAFGGTCPISPDSPTAGSSVAVNRPPEPYVTTQDCTDIALTSVTGNGNIVGIGKSSPTKRGFCYKEGTTGDPTTEDSTVYDTGTFSTGVFTKSITGLTAGTNYRVRAYAINSAGTGYGTTVTVTTTSIVAPTVTTSACTNTDADSTQGNGNITDTGGENCTRRGFCYKVGTSGDPTTSDSVVYDDGSFGTGAFTKTITGLTPNTSYRVRAYAVNSAGTGYGTTVSVTPTVATTTTGVSTMTGVQSITF